MGKCLSQGLRSKSDYVSDYTYGDINQSINNAGVNAARFITKTNGLTATYSYDKSGNMQSGDGKTLTYDAYNKPLTISRDSITSAFSYGADLSRYKQVKTGLANGTETTIYIDKAYEETTQGTVTTKKVYLGDIAVIIETIGGTEPGHKIGFTHRDRLGSIVTITDHLGNVVDNKTYDPFGKPKKGNLKNITTPTLKGIVEQSNLIPGINYSLYTNRGFTDHEHLDDAQLIHMNGRVYDYNLGRFLSVDPFIQAPGNSQSMNPYSYIMNNPLAGVDPSGYASSCDGSQCDQSGQQPSSSNTTGSTATTNGNKSTIAIVNVYRDNSENVCSDCHGETQKTGNTIVINYSNGDVDSFCFECSTGSETSESVTGSPSGESGWNITAEQHKTLSSLAGEDRRTEYYLALYEMTGSNLAIQMAQISSNSGFLGGVAWEANQQIKDDFGESYPGTIENFSTMVFKNDFAQITPNGNGGFHVPSDLKMTQATVNLWKSVGLGDVAPPQVLLDNLKYGMAGGAAVSTFRVPQAMGYVGAATYNETYGNQRGIYKGQFMKDHPNASVSYTQDRRFMMMSGDKVYSNINVHPTKDIVVYPTFQ